MTARLYLVRHGQAAPPGIMLGQTDLPLSAAGREQVASLARQLSGIAFTATWSSPLQRARQTAGIILSENTADTASIMVEPDLREISLGAWEGRDTSWVRQHYADVWEARGRDFARVAPPGGESAADLAARVLPVFKRICREAAGHTYSLLTAHQAVNRVILADIMGISLDDLRSIPQPPAALTVLEVDAAGIASLGGK